MELNYKLIDKKLNTPIETQTTEETTVASGTSPAPVPIVTTTSGEQQQKVEVSPEAKAQAETDAAEVREARASAHDAQVKEIEEAKKAAMSSAEAVLDSTPKSPEVPSGNNNVSEKFTKILKDENTTLEQKTRALLEQYYSEHDPNFANLSDEEKEIYINQKLAEFIKKFGSDSENLSDKDKVKALMKISVLVFKSEKDGVALDDLANKPAEELDGIFKDSQKEMFSHFIESLENEEPDVAIDKALTVYLMSSDPDFALKTPKEQKSIIAAHRKEFAYSLGINDVSNDSKKSIKNFTVAILKHLNKTGETIDDFKNKSKADKEEFLLEVLSNNGEYYQNSPKEVQNKIDSLLLLASYKEDDDVTYGDFFARMDEKIKNGEIEDEDEIARYNDLKKTCNPDDKISFNSLTIKAILSSDTDEGANKLSNSDVNKLVAEQVNLILNDVDPNSDLSDEKIKYLVEATNVDCNVDYTIIIADILRDKGFSDEKIAQFIEKINAERQILNSRNDQGNSSGKITSLVSKYGSIVQKAKVELAVAEAVRNHSDNYATDVLSGINYDENNQMTNAVTKAVNETRTKEDAFNIYINAINVTQPERKAAITQSSIETASTEQKLYYGKEYAQIKDAAVTQGLAAATYNETDTDVKTQLNSYVNYAVQNNGYSSDEINNINTARETGKTSYTSSSESTNSNSVSNTNSARNSGNSETVNNTSSSNNGVPNNNSGVTPQRTSSSAVTSAKVVVSAQTQASINAMRDSIAQLQLSYSIQIRDKALDSLEHIITKIQDDQQVRAQKQAEQKEALEKKEEIAKILEEVEVQMEKGERVKVATDVVENQVAKKFGIPQDVVDKLRTAAKEGDLSAIYSLLGGINSRAQEHFILHIAGKSETALAGFIRNHANDKELIKMLIHLNPNLIKSIDTNVLLSCGIEKAEIIKYADATQFKTILADLSKIGDTQQLKQFCDALGDDAELVASTANVNIPGTDAFYKFHNVQHINNPIDLERDDYTASFGSDKVSMRHDIEKRVRYWG